MEAAVESQGGKPRFRPLWLCHASPCPTRGQVLHQAQLRQKASIGDTEGRKEKDRSAFLCGFRSFGSLLALERCQLTMLASFFVFPCPNFASGWGTRRLPPTRNSDMRKGPGMTEMEEDGRRRAAVVALRLPRFLLAGVQVKNLV